MKNTLHYLAIASLIGLIVLCMAWEGWLAPVHPGGSAAVLKAMPLLLPLFGILRGKIYTYQWSSMLILLYFAEGLTRLISDRGTAAWLAGIEMTLALVFYFSVIFYVRLAKKAGKPA